MSIFSPGKSPEQLGSDHLQLCNKLIQDGYGINDGTQYAVSQLSKKDLRQADASEAAANAVLAAIVDPEYLSMREPVRFLFQYSLFVATQKNGLQGSLYRMSGQDAANEVLMILTAQLRAGDYASVLSGSDTANRIGQALADAFITGKLAVITGLAKRALGKQNEAKHDLEMAGLFLAMAEEQCAGDPNALSMIRGYAQMAAQAAAEIEEGVSRTPSKASPEVAVPDLGPEFQSADVRRASEGSRPMNDIAGVRAALLEIFQQYVSDQITDSHAKELMYRVLRDSAQVIDAAGPQAAAYLNDRSGMENYTGMAYSLMLLAAIERFSKTS